MLGKANKSSLSVTIFDIQTSITTNYTSMRQAAKAINSDFGVFSKLEKRKNPDKPFKNRYIITIHR